MRAVAADCQFLNLRKPVARAGWLLPWFSSQWRMVCCGGDGLVLVFRFVGELGCRQIKLEKNKQRMLVLVLLIGVRTIFLTCIRASES